MTTCGQRIGSLVTQRIRYGGIESGAQQAPAADAPPLSDQERRVLELFCMAKTQRVRLRALVPWLSAFGLARVLVAFVQMDLAPVIVVANCESLRRHYGRFTFRELTHVSASYPLRDWDGERFTPLPRRPTEKTSAIWVKDLPLAHTLAQEHPDSVVVVWEDEYREFDEVDPHRLPHVAEAMLCLRTHLNPEWEVEASAQFEGCPASAPPPAPAPVGMRDAAWEVHAHRLRVASTGTRLEQLDVGSEDASLRRLSEATFEFMGRHDQRSPGSWFCLRLASRLHRRLAQRTTPVEEAELTIIRELREHREILPVALRDLWLHWVDAYADALRAHVGRLTSKAHQAMEALADPDFRGVLLAPTREDARALRRACRDAGVPPRVMAPDDVDWRDLLREGLPEGLREPWRASDLASLELMGPPKQKDMAHLSGGLTSIIRARVYPHETPVLRARAWTIRQLGVSATRRNAVEIHEAHQAPDERHLERLLAGLAPRAAAARGEDAAEAPFDVDHDVDGPRVAVMTDHGRRVYPRERQLYAVRHGDLNAFPAHEIRSGDRIIEVPRLAGNAGDLVQAVLQASSATHEVVTEALSWRQILLYHHRAWKTLHPEGTFEEFLRAKLPHVVVRPETVRAWLEGHTEVPLDHNARPMLEDIGFDETEIEGLLRAHALYRSLRAQAHNFLRAYLVRLIHAHEPPNAGGGRLLPALEERAELRDALAEHVEGARLLLVQAVVEVETS